jgi:hypothetical protein
MTHIFFQNLRTCQLLWEEEGHDNGPNKKALEP